MLEKNLQNLPNPENNEHNEGLEDALAIKNILDDHEDERVLVLAPPGAGKSTLLNHIENGIDMDNVLFPQLSTELKEYMFQKEWQPDAHDRSKHQMIQRLIERHVEIEPGKPLFSTVLVSADFVLSLSISDELLASRLEQRAKDNDRPQDFEKTLKIRDRNTKELESSDTPFETYELTPGKNEL